MGSGEISYPSTQTSSFFYLLVNWSSDICSSNSVYHVSTFRDFSLHSHSSPCFSGPLGHGTSVGHVSLVDMDSEVSDAD